MVTNNERWVYKVFKRVPNSPYEWDREVSFTFKGRPASQQEKRIYRIQQGVNGGSDSLFVYATNIPNEIDVGDKIIFQKKEWEVKSVGYYYDASRFVNPNLMNEEYIAKKCPKGINIQ